MEKISAVVALSMTVADKSRLRTEVGSNVAEQPDADSAVADCSCAAITTAWTARILPIVASYGNLLLAFCELTLSPDFGNRHWSKLIATVWPQSLESAWTWK